MPAEAVAAVRPFNPGLWIDRAVGRAIEVAGAILLIVEIVLLLTNVIARYVFGDPLVMIDELSSVLFLWLAMLGAVLALRRAGHMRMTAVVNRSSPTPRRLLRTDLGLCHLRLPGPDLAAVHQLRAERAGGHAHHHEPLARLARGGDAGGYRAHAGVDAVAYPQPARRVGAGRFGDRGRDLRRSGSAGPGVSPTRQRQSGDLLPGRRGGDGVRRHPHRLFLRPRHPGLSRPVHLHPGLGADLAHGCRHDQPGAARHSAVRVPGPAA